MLKQRVLTAMVLVFAVLWLLFAASEQVWRWAFLGVAAVSAWEWAAFANRKLLPERLAYVIVVVLSTWGLLNFADVSQLLNSVVVQDSSTEVVFSWQAFIVELWPLLSILPLLLWVVFLVRRYQSYQGRAVLTHPGMILLLGVWTIAIFTYSMVVLHQLLSPAEILLSMLAIWSIDTGAYFVGHRFGKTKLAAYVSPGKTWEGVIGGGSLALVVLWLGGSWLGIEGQMSTVGFVVLGTIIALLSVFGDLFQSVLKRQVGLKDSGHILPGHGGILDRIDSLLIAMPLFALLWLGSLVL